MTRRSRGGSSPFAWTAVFYLLVILTAGFWLAQADDQVPMNDSAVTGPGKQKSGN